MSYEAFIAGRRFVYCPELPQVSKHYMGFLIHSSLISCIQHLTLTILQCLQLTDTVLSYKKQKTRWIKGFFQVARKSLRRILTSCSHLPLSVRIEAFFHMTSPITSFLGLIILFLSPVMVVIHGELPRTLMILSFLPCIPFTVSGIIACYAKVPGPNQHYSSFWERTMRLRFIPLAMALSGEYQDANILTCVCVYVIQVVTHSFMA